jgi:predicted ATPase
MLSITRIRIKNFRSIKDCTFDLKDLQLLIGPNNSGKTNLLRAITFLASVTDSTQAQKIDISLLRFQHKEYHEKKTRANQRPDPIEIAVELNDGIEPQRYVYYKMELFLFTNSSQPRANDSSYNEFIGISKSKLNENQFNELRLDNLKSLQQLFSDAAIVRNHTITLNDDPLADVVLNKFQGNTIYSYSLEITSSEIKFIAIEFPLGTFLSLSGVNPSLQQSARQVRELFQSIKIYKPDTFYIKLPMEIQKVEAINSNCDNIVSYLEYLSSSDRERFNLVNEELHRCIPDFKGINFETVEGSDKINMRILRLKDLHNVNHFAEDISDGTLYFLTLFAIISQKNMPGVLMLEEPETGIHPRRISEIMNYIFKLREQYPHLPIIITTHHPYVVDHFSEMTDRVWIFDSVNGETKIKNLERDVINPSDKRMKEEKMEPIDYTSSLGEHWSLGFLGGVPKPVR